MEYTTLHHSLAASHWKELIETVVWPLLLIVLGYIVERLDKLTRRRKREAKAYLDQSQWLDSRIHDLINQLRDRLDADRAFMSRFHNGDYYIDGSDLLKKTRTHESVRDGLAYQAEMFKGLLVSTMVDEIPLVIEDGPSFFIVKDLPRGKFKWLCIQGGVKSGARCSIRKGGKIVGFVGVDFGTECPPDNIDFICECAHRIELLI